MATEPVWLLVSARQLGPKPVTGSLWVPTVTRLSSQSQRAVRLSHRVSHPAPPSLLENPSSQSPWAVKLSQVSVNTLLLVCMKVFVFLVIFCCCFSLRHVFSTVPSLIRHCCFFCESFSVLLRVWILSGTCLLLCGCELSALHHLKYQQPSLQIEMKAESHAPTTVYFYLP